MLSLFFFSSRRRHTRYWRDWSSDVCSSDLVDHIVAAVAPDLTLYVGRVGGRHRRLGHKEGGAYLAVHQRAEPFFLLLAGPVRSEERRVGKECRSRWSPYH